MVIMKKKRPNNMLPLQMTLSDLLENPNEIVRNNAMIIFKALTKSGTRLFCGCFKTDCVFQNERWTCARHGVQR